MVKGNWERRAELVAARRIEERNKKAQKLVGSKDFATAESVITKIFRDSGVEQAGTRIDAWIQQESDVVAVCRSWLRTETCRHKKCKFSHESNIAYLRGIIYTDNDEQPTEILSSGPVELRSVAKKDYNKLRFLAVGGLCVYDFHHPEVWEAWYTPRIQIQPEKTTKLTVIKESAEEHIPPDDGTRCNMPPISELALSSSHKSASSHIADFAQFFLDFRHQTIVPFSVIFSHLIPFLCTGDLIRLSTAGKALLVHCNKVDVFRLRRKEGLSVLAVEQSKAKKAEQRKKIKQANVKKEPKKDGFARGGNG